MRICKAWFGRVFGKRRYKSVRQHSMKDGFLTNVDKSGYYTKYTFTNCNKFGTRKTEMQKDRNRNVGSRFMIK